MTRAVRREEQKAELDAVLASESFAKSHNLARLLGYLCDRYFDGMAASLKEYNIAVEALGRPPDFDPSSNSAVRVELHRLREKLKRYYEAEGSHDPVAIVLEPGSYIPHFVSRPEARPPFLSEAAPLGRFRGEPLEVKVEPRVEEWLPKTSRQLSLRGSNPLQVLAGRPRLWALAAFSAVLIVFAGLTVEKWKRASPLRRTVASSGPGANDLASTALAGQEVRILAGYSKGNYIDRAGRVWGPDRYFSGGTSLAAGPRYIDRTSDPTLYLTSRYGDFAYNIPLQPGVYELRLYFAETVYGSNTLAGGGESSRTFNVELNGKAILTEFDPLADAGASNTADVRVLRDVTPASDGQLHLRFSRYEGPSPPQDQAALSAIEIVPGIPGRMLPIRLVAQNNCFTDSGGQVWRPDDYASQGRLALHNRPVEQTLDPGLYYGERFGHFSYAIPVAKGKYVLTLHFAETYFGTENVGGGGVESRLFDVYCNGVRILENFDILKQARGANRALVKTFHNLEPNPQGKLLLTFVPVKNYACVNAIEVADESD